MIRLGREASVLAAVVAAVVLVGGGLIPNARALTPDPSNVVLVLDFSASILEDKTTRNRFAAALDRIAARVDETAPDLVAGDATVSIVQFAARAADVSGCVDLRLLQSPAAVGRFADCIRFMARDYRKGLSGALTKKIGVDTNYVAAMEKAATHLPAASIRPALILFTDGKHDVRGVPVSQVEPTRQRLFGQRTPFALLPVGMGLDPKNRAALEAGLKNLRITRDMPACVSGATFDWPQVVFQTADQAGTAVALALQNATCTFSVAPTPTPKPIPTPGAVNGIRLVAGDSKIELTWSPAAVTAPVPIIDYTARCRAGEGDWIESTEGVSSQPKATVEGLANGTTYTCEVAAVGANATGAWTPASGDATPFGRPPAPPRPAIEALNGGVRLSVPATDPAVPTTIHYECSADNGATWPADGDVSAVDPNATVGGLTNGVAYVCRAFAQNTIGQSDASPISDSAKPCSSSFECNPLLVPLLGGLGALLVGGILVAVFALLRSRTRGYVIAVVDIVHTANIGSGSKLGISLARDPNTKSITGIVVDRGSHADVRIRRLRGGRFEVIDRIGKHITADGEAVIVSDSVGVRHSLTLRAFATNAASAVATRR